MTDRGQAWQNGHGPPLWLKIGRAYHDPRNGANPIPHDGEVQGSCVPLCPATALTRRLSSSTIRTILHCDNPTEGLNWRERPMSKVARVKITRKGQMTIPQTLREDLDIEPGDYVALRRRMGGILISKATVTPRFRLRTSCAAWSPASGRRPPSRGSARKRTWSRSLRKPSGGRTKSATTDDAPAAGFPGCQRPDPGCDLSSLRDADPGRPGGVGGGDTRANQATGSQMRPTGKRGGFLRWP